MNEFTRAKFALVLGALFGTAALLTVVPVGGVAALGVPDPQSVTRAGGEPVAFEAASIKPAAIGSRDGEGSSRSAIQCADDGILMRNIDLEEIVQWAYGLDGSQVLGSKALQGQRYDIRARAGDRVTVSTLRRMVQDLLNSRFNLRTHQEERLTRVYDLEVARGGVQLTRSKADPPAQGSAKENLPQVIDGSFVFRNVSLSEFAQQLSELRGIEFPVIDRTGIQGTYDITLQSAAHEVLESNGASLGTLIREQLGLKLVPTKELREVLVIDQAEKPSPD